MIKSIEFKTIDEACTYAGKAMARAASSHLQIRLRRTNERFIEIDAPDDVQDKLAELMSVN